MSDSKPSPFDYVNSINKKTGMIEDISGYMPFMINRAFSQYPDTIFFANEGNKLTQLDRDMHYRFYYNGVTKKNRFSKWGKQPPREEEVTLIMELYNYSREKAEEVLPLFSKETLKALTARGGKHGK